MGLRSYGGVMMTENTKVNTHYIGMAGISGCIPSTCDVFETYDDAVDSLGSLHELGRKRSAQFRKNGYIELNLHKDGNEYAEIVECDCDDPSQHSDSGGF
jgi:hypothetical protein